MSLGRWLFWAGVALAWIAALPAARVRAEALRVHVADGACPDRELLSLKLAPLLPDTELVFDASVPESSAPDRAVVRDLGERYMLAFDRLDRELADPARDCVERARVIAVLIALNRARAARGDALASSAQEAAPEAEAEAEPGAGGPMFGIRLAVDGGYSAPLERAALGGAAGVWLANGALRLAFTAGVLSPADVPLASDRGAVALTRFPLVASAGYALQLGRFELAPGAGLAVDVLHLRGRGVPRAETELRLNSGALLALDTRLRVSPRLLVLLRLGLHAFPRAYDLSLEPFGALARTPRLWLNASLGLDFAL